MTRDETALRDLLRGAGLRWSGTSIGLYPTVHSATAEKVHAMGPAAIPALIDALSREEDFAAAHVLLTRLTGVEYESSPAWNGLAVDIAADGSVTVDPRQRQSLIRRWRQWQAAGPHPNRLPPDPG